MFKRTWRRVARTAWWPKLPRGRRSRPTPLCNRSTWELIDEVAYGETECDTRLHSRGYTALPARIFRMRENRDERTAASLRSLQAYPTCAAVSYDSKWKLNKVTISLHESIRPNVYLNHGNVIRTLMQRQFIPKKLRSSPRTARSMIKSAPT